MVFWKKKPKRKTVPKPKKTVSPSKNIPKPIAPTPQNSPRPKPKNTSISNQVEPKKPILSKDAEKEFLEVFKQLTHRHRNWDVWKDFVVMTACALSNSVDKLHYKEREDRYLRIIKKYNKQEQSLFPELLAHTVMALEKNPEQDFLGHIFMLLNLGDSGKQQIFTPYSVCQTMAGITVKDVVKRVQENGYITINDSCCGAGATLIAGIHEARRQLEKAKLNFQNHILVVAQDIDETVALMCYIQLSLLGIAAYIKIGNALTDPISTRDTFENYWFTPMYFSDVWITRRTFQNLAALEKEN